MSGQAVFFGVSLVGAFGMAIANFSDFKALNTSGSIAVDIRGDLNRFHQESYTTTYVACGRLRLEFVSQGAIVNVYARSAGYSGRRQGNEILLSRQLGDNARNKRAVSIVGNAVEHQREIMAEMARHAKVGEYLKASDEWLVEGEQIEEHCAPSDVIYRFAEPAMDSPQTPVK